MKIKTYVKVDNNFVKKKLLPALYALEENNILLLQFLEDQIDDQHIISIIDHTDSYWFHQ